MNNFDKNTAFCADNKVASKPTELNKKETPEEEVIKSHKKSIIVGSTIVGIGGLLMLLNPKNSPKLAAKLKNWQASATRSIEKNKDNYLKSKFHKFGLNTINWSLKTLDFLSNANLVKDLGFKWLCTEKKPCLNIKNTKLRELVVKADNGFRKVMTKPYNAITRWFDSISKYTIKQRYKVSAKNMDNLESMILANKDKLSPSELAQVETILKDIENYRKFFSEFSVLQRLDKQGELMVDLERDVIKKFNAYKNGFTNRWVEKSGHITKNLSYWPEEVLLPVRENLEKNGLKKVEKLFGNGSEIKGEYEKIFEIISPHLDDGSKIDLQNMLKNAKKRLLEDNHNECVKYFDKKRDLILGSAPTDVLSAIFGLGLSAYAIGAADTKDDRISRSLTVAFPVVAGFAANMAFTAMLFSGAQSLVLGGLTSWGLSHIGNFADKRFFHKDLREQKQSNTTMEVNNA